jgi:hypothetical protein
MNVETTVERAVREALAGSVAGEAERFGSAVVAIGSAGGFGQGEFVQAPVFADGEFDVSNPGGSRLVGGDRDRAVPDGDE